MIIWPFGAEERYTKRGGAGYGVTTTAGTATSYGATPPSSTHSRWHGTGKQPEIAGSTGGFIGLVSGLAIFVLVSAILGIYLWNRFYRKRLPSQSNSTTIPLSHPRSGTQKRSKPTLPFLSISRPSTDPYSQSLSGSDLNETPKASSFGNTFTRPVYTRSRSSEWDMPHDGSSSRGSSVGQDDRRTVENEMSMSLPGEPGEVVLPLRSIHHKSDSGLSPSASMTSFVAPGTRQERSEYAKEYPDRTGLDPFDQASDAEGHDGLLAGGDSDDGTEGDTHPPLVTRLDGPGVGH